MKREESRIVYLGSDKLREESLLIHRSVAVNKVSTRDRYFKHKQQHKKERKMFINTCTCHVFIYLFFLSERNCRLLYVYYFKYSNIVLDYYYYYKWETAMYCEPQT